MDTKLKKFNLSALFKFIAVVLCLACVGGTVCQLVTTWVYVEKYDLQGEHFYDALYNTNNKNVALTNSFERQADIYMSKVSRLVTAYGDGSKEDYEKVVAAKKEKDRATVEKTKKNLVAWVEKDSDGFANLVSAVSHNLAENCGYLKAPEGAAGDEEIVFFDDNYSNVSANIPWLSETDEYDNEGVYSNTELTAQAATMKLTSKADGVILIPSAANVYNADVLVKTYPAGYYFFKVNEENLIKELSKNDIIEDVCSYEQFRKDYEALKADIEQNYPSGRYYIKDVLGNTYTNVEKLKSSKDRNDVEKYFSTLGFYCFGDDSFNMLLPDGTPYNPSFAAALEGNIYDEGAVVPYVTEHTTMFTVDDAPTVPETTAIYETTTVVHTNEAPQEPTTAVTDINDITTAVDSNLTTTVQIVAPTSNQRGYNGTSPFVVATDSPSDMTLYFGVDYKDKAYESGDCCFSTVQRDIYAAFSMTKGLVVICGGLTLLLIALFIFLIIKSGRRFGDKENVYMLPGDNMFTDWRIIIDCGFGFLVCLAVYWLIDAFLMENAVNEFIIFVFGALASALGFFVIDLVLFITRHIKNKTLLKRFFLVWLIRKLVKKAGQKLAPVKGKLQYVKGFEKQTVFKGVIVLILNAFLGLAAIVELVNTETLWFSFVLIGFDLFVAIQLIRFIAGVKKIFSAVNEIKQGNYEIQINLYALPSSLREPANKLMSLRDGLKGAVEEAVRQEQTKTELITNVSHDLKTPLTSIINYVDLLKKCDIKDETALEYLTILGEKSDRLKKLIEDLVEASKASTGNIKLNIVEVSLNEILHQISGEFSDEFEKRGLNLISDIPEESITVLTDSKSLYRILENLMGNVTKYAMENTRVYLSLWQKEGRNIITVKNISGSPLNISANELMERFVRADESRSSSGNGLGLSIAQSLCTLLGGKLEIEINGDLFVANVEL